MVILAINVGLAQMFLVSWSAIKVTQAKLNAFSGCKKNTSFFFLFFFLFLGGGVFGGRANVFLQLSSVSVAKDHLFASEQRVAVCIISCRVLHPRCSAEIFITLSQPVLYVFLYLDSFLFFLLFFFFFCAAELLQMIFCERFVSTEGVSLTCI